MSADYKVAWVAVPEGGSRWEARLGDEDGEVVAVVLKDSTKFVSEMGVVPLYVSFSVLDPSDRVGHLDFAKAKEQALRSYEDAKEHFDTHVRGRIVAITTARDEGYPSEVGVARIVVDCECYRSLKVGDLVEVGLVERS